jgi:hypothetical protein
MDERIALIFILKTSVLYSFIGEGRNCRTFILDRAGINRKQDQTDDYVYATVEYYL